MHTPSYIDHILLARDGAMEGTITRELGRCPYGCGARISVKWDDGHRTYPCTAGITEVSEGVFKLV